MNANEIPEPINDQNRANANALQETMNKIHSSIELSCNLRERVKQLEDELKKVRQENLDLQNRANGFDLLFKNGEFKWDGFTPQDSEDSRRMFIAMKVWFLNASKWVHENLERFKRFDDLQQENLKLRAENEQLNDELHRLRKFLRERAESIPVVISDPLRNIANDPSSKPTGPTGVIPIPPDTTCAATTTPAPTDLPSGVS